MVHYIEKLLDPTGRAGRLIRSTHSPFVRHTHSPLDAYPTELPGINEILAEIRDDYNIWLISNSLLGKSYRSWVMGVAAGGHIF